MAIYRIGLRGNGFALASSRQKVFLPLPNVPARPPCRMSPHGVLSYVEASRRVTEGDSAGVALRRGRAPFGARRRPCRLGRPTPSEACRRRHQLGSGWLQTLARGDGGFVADGDGGAGAVDRGERAAAADSRDRKWTLVSHAERTTTSPRTASQCSRRSSWVQLRHRVRLVNRRLGVRVPPPAR